MTTSDRIAIRAGYEATFGLWDASLDALLEVSPETVGHFLSYAALPWSSAALTRKDKALISLAVHASATTLHAPGVDYYTRLARHHGAAKGEIVEVLQLVSVVGIHSATTGLPIAFEIFDGEDEAPAPGHDALRESFAAKRGYWNEILESLLRASPAFLESYTAFSSVPWREGSLTARLKELVYVAMNASASHLFEPGLKIHIANARGHGASLAEIVTTLQLAGLLGQASLALGGQALLDRTIEAHP